MSELFEDQLMDIQSDMVTLCLEYIESRADKVFVFGSIEDRSYSFNAFFEIRKNSCMRMK